MARENNVIMIVVFPASLWKSFCLRGYCHDQKKIHFCLQFFTTENISGEGNLLTSTTSNCFSFTHTKVIEC